jgi:hypothetical protein
MSPVEQHVEAEEAPGGVPEDHALLLLGLSHQARGEVSRWGAWLFIIWEMILLLHGMTFTRVSTDLLAGAGDSQYQRCRPITSERDATTTHLPVPR